MYVATALSRPSLLLLLLSCASRTSPVASATVALVAPPKAATTNVTIYAWTVATVDGAAAAAVTSNWEGCTVRGDDDDDGTRPDHVVPWCARLLADVDASTLDAANTSTSAATTRLPCCYRCCLEHRSWTNRTTVLMRVVEHKEDLAA